MELKFKPHQLFRKENCWFNRTFMELKYRNAHDGNTPPLGFNRTFMELKSTLFSEKKKNICLV